MERPGEISRWAQERRTLINAPHGLPPQYARNVGLVQWRFPSMGQALGTKRRADPYVVALALTYDTPDQRWIVVTKESRNGRIRRKVPNACDELGLRCISLDELIELELPGGGHTEDEYEPI